MHTLTKVNVIEEVIESAVAEAAMESVREAAKEFGQNVASAYAERLYEEIPSSAEYAELERHFHLRVDVETDEFGHPTVAGDQALKRAVKRYTPMIRVKCEYPWSGLEISLTSGTTTFVKWDPAKREWYAHRKGDPDLERAYYMG